MTEEVQESEAVEATDAPAEAPEAEAQQEQPQAPAWSDDDAQEARAFGWKSPDEWVGDIPAGYIDDPKRYLARAENFRPFKKLKEQLEADRTAAQREREDFETRTRRLEAMNARALERQRADLMAARDDAFDMADRDKFQRVQRQIDELPGLQREAPQQQPQPADPYVKEYEAQNEWVNNPILRDAGAKLIDANPAMRQASAKDQIAYAEAEVRKMYPSYFPKQEATRPPMQQRVDGGGLAGAGGKASAFAKMPAEAKSAFKKFVGEGLFKDTEEDRKRYADDYNAA